MKKIFFLFLVTMSMVNMYGQVDVIKFHNGKSVEGTVVRVNEMTIVYKYVNENVENTVSKYAVESIKYGGSGRVEEMSEKIVINNAEDWAKVIIVDDKSQVVGLTRVGEVRGKTSFINMRTPNGNDKRALEKMKKAAAEMGCPYVLFVSENKSVGDSANTIGGTQVAKNGVGYKY